MSGEGAKETGIRGSLRRPPRPDTASSSSSSSSLLPLAAMDAAHSSSAPASLNPLASSSSNTSASIIARKLAALGYNAEGALHESSMKLIGSLLTDLIHTTEAYRDAKSSSSEAARGAAEWSDQKDVMRRENIKLVRENNRLHKQLVEDKEMKDISDREDGKKVKEAEEELARMMFWKEQQLERQQAMEDENMVLRKKVDELLSKGTRTSSVGGESVKLDVEPTKIIVSGPLFSEKARKFAKYEKDTSESSSMNVDGDDAEADSEASTIKVKQANERASAAEALSRSLQSEVKSLHEAIDVAASSLELREKEIERLSTIVEIEGESLEKLAAEHKSEVNERLVSSLNQQVDFLTEQLANAQEAANYRFQLEEKLGRTQETLAAVELEAKELQKKLGKLEEERKVAKLEDANNSDKKLMEKLRNDLKKSDDALADSSKQSEQLVAQREAAILQYQQAEAKLLELEAVVRHTQDALDTQTAAYERVTSERDAALQAKSAFRESAERSANSSQVIKDELRLAEEKLRIAEKSLTDSHDSVQRAKAESSQAIIIARDANEKRVNAESASRAASVENELIQQQLQVLRKELAAAQEALEANIDSKNSSEGELRQVQGELDITKKEKMSLQADLKILSEKLAEESASAASASLSEEKISKMVIQIESYQEKLAELNEQVGGHAARTAAAEVEANKFEVAAQRAIEKQEQLEELLQNTTSERDAIRVRQIELEFEHKKTTGQLEELQRKQGTESTAKEEVTNELTGLRDSIRVLEMKLSKSHSEVSDAQSRVMFLESEVVRITDENAVLSSRLKTSHEASDAAHIAEMNAATDTASLREELSMAIISRENARKEAAEASSRVITAEKRASDAEMRSDSLSKEVADRTRDINRLKALISSLDNTREELVYKIETLTAEAKLHNERLAEERSSIDALNNEMRVLRERCDKVTTALTASDAERDKLQIELDAQSEEIHTLKTSLQREQAEMESLRVTLSASESRTARSDRALEEAQASTSNLTSELESLKSDMSKLRAEHRGKTEELYALSDDLSSMTREQQIVNAELLRERSDKERMAAELARQREACEGSASRLRVKENEMEELIVAYQELGTENRRLEHNVCNLERELQESQSTLRHREASVESVRKQIREIEDENRRYVIDLQAFERQVDSLTRQLAVSDERQNDLSDGKVHAMANLGNAQQVIMELERARENVQRELAATAAKLDVANDKLSILIREKDNIVSQLRAERGRSTGLEELVGKLRMREHISTPLRESLENVNEKASIKQLEQKIAFLQTSLNDKEAELQNIKSLPSFTGEKIDELALEEKERLLSLLGKMDAERSQLQDDNAELLRRMSEAPTSSSLTKEGGQVSLDAYKKLEFVKSQKELALEQAQQELRRIKGEMGLLQSEYNALFEASDNEEE